MHTQAVTYTDSVLLFLIQVFFFTLLCLVIVSLPSAVCRGDHSTLSSEDLPLLIFQFLVVASSEHTGASSASPRGWLVWNLWSRVWLGTPEPHRGLQLSHDEQGSCVDPAMAPCLATMT